MKIAILGAGAMGSLYGGYLSTNNEVYLIDIWKDHVDAINANGLKIEEANEEVTFHPKAVSSADEVGAVDLVIVFVKSTQTYSALQASKALLGPKTIVLSLQNGYGNHEDLARLVDENLIVIGVTSHGGTMLAPGKIKHAGKGPTTIGSLTKDISYANEVAKTLSDAGFEAKVNANVIELVWHKLFINVGINAITALMRETNNIVSINQFARETSTMLVTEAVGIANSLGCSFDLESELSDVFAISEATGTNRSSMLQDVEKKRATEISKINGAVVKAAESQGLEAPYNKLITSLISAVESSYLQ